MIDILSMAPCSECDHPSDFHKVNRYHYERHNPRTVAVCNQPFCTCIRKLPTEPPYPKPKTTPIYSSYSGRIIGWK